MRRIIVTLGLVVVVGAAFACLAWVFQRRLIYFPAPLTGLTPAHVGLEFREVAATASDAGTVHGWYVEPPIPDPSGTVVLFSHGNGGNIEHRIEHARVLSQHGFAVLLYDYRGYGDSPGAPTEDGCYRDAEAAYDWLVNEAGVEPDQIVAWGESLGGAVAVELALRRPVAALVLESTFSSLAATGSGHYPWLPVHLLLRDRFDSLAKAPRLALPVLQFHGAKDGIVPIERGRDLHTALPEPKALVETAGGHNAGGPLVQGGVPLARVVDFLGRRGHGDSAAERQPDASLGD